MKTLSLSGKYKMYFSDSKEKIFTAEIPGSDIGNLIRNKVIENPLNNVNCDSICTDIAKHDAIFEKSFIITRSDLDFSAAVLKCSGVDTICRCLINSKVAFESENAHTAIECNVKNLLKEGTNIIKFEIFSSVNYIAEKQKYKPLPKNFNGTDGAAYIRKPSCHFGWDWGPCVPYKYIGNTQLLFFNKRISDIKISQKHYSDGTVRVFVNARGAEKITLLAPDLIEIPKDKDSFLITDPELWYPRDINLLDTQPLYTVIFSNEDMRTEKKIGLRTVELDTSPDEYGNNFQIRVNSKRVFAKGANLIPIAAVPEFAGNEKIDSIIEHAVNSGFNMIRVWGGGTYADEYFLSRCDEAGILVWQDFCFACLLYPFYDRVFLSNVLKEVEYNVKRMEHHASLCLWCGNNEIESMYSYMPRNSKIIKSYISFFYEILPGYIKNLTSAPYIPSSPLGSRAFEKNTSDDVGDTHMWNVWHGLKSLDYYEKRYTRFLSEFGLESLPSMKSIKTFAKSKSDFNLSSPAFISHQKCSGGNEKMMFYLEERFGKTAEFEYLPYLTGIVQAECIKSAAEHFRINKGRCNGTVFWQFNDVWNCPSWSGVDFEGVPKAVMYKAKEFFAPVNLILRDNRFIAVNDTLYDIALDFEMTYSNGKAKKISALLAADSLTYITDADIPENCSVKVCFGEHIRIFSNVKSLSRVTLQTEKYGNKIIISADKFAKNVYIECDQIPDKNYFDVFPGDKVTVTFAGEPNEFRIVCENNIDFVKSTLSKRLSHFLYRLKPENIANYFYYEYN